MNDFSAFYKDGINLLHIPDYSIEDLRNPKRHQKYIKERKRERLAAAVLMILIFSAVASATAYAAYTIHKNIQFTSYGIKIDFSDQKSQSDQNVHNDTDTDTVVSYSDIYGAPAYDLQDYTDEITDESATEDYTFDNWADALSVIDFPIVYPENIQYSALYINFYQTAAFKGTLAVYTVPGRKAIEISYTNYLIKNWSFAEEYNAQIWDKHIYTNKYKYKFWVTECQYGDVAKRTNVMTYINDYTIRISFMGYDAFISYQFLRVMISFFLLMA